MTIIGSEDECYSVARVIRRWVELRKEYGDPVGETSSYVDVTEWEPMAGSGGANFRKVPDQVRESAVSQLLTDMWKSRLFNRLLQGKEPLPVAPPRSYAGPWYELIEQGEGTCSAHIDLVTLLATINHDRWEIIGTRIGEPTVYTVRHPGATTLDGEAAEWELRPPTDEEIDLKGLQERTAGGVAWDIVKDEHIPGIIEFRRNNHWKLTRLPA